MKAVVKSHSALESWRTISSYLVAKYVEMWETDYRGFNATSKSLVVRYEDLGMSETKEHTLATLIRFLDMPNLLRPFDSSSPNKTYNENHHSQRRRRDVESGRVKCAFVLADDPRTHRSSRSAKEASTTAALAAGRELRGQHETPRRMLQAHLRSHRPRVSTASQDPPPTLGHGEGHLVAKNLNASRAINHGGRSHSNYLTKQDVYDRSTVCSIWEKLGRWAGPYGYKPYGDMDCIRDSSPEESRMREPAEPLEGP